MNQGRGHYVGVGERRPLQVGSPVVSLEWREEWFTNLCLAVVLAVVMFLMLLSIYLVVTKPEPSSNPERKVTPFQGNSFAEAPPSEAEDLVTSAFLPAVSVV